MGRIRIGISGWSYPSWRGDFYPTHLPQRARLEYAAARMSAIEINASFYSLQRPSSYVSWRAAAPDGFVYGVKGGRFITHMKRLAGARPALANFLASGVLHLGPMLGPILWQLPERLAYDAGLLATFFRSLPRTHGAAAELAESADRKPEDGVPDELDADRPLRHVLEFRHPSFCSDEAIGLLRDHDIGCVVADTAGRWPYVEAVTSDVVYVRLHGHEKLYYGGYDAPLLDTWAARCRAWSEEADVFVFFDNDADGRAPHDAMALIDRLGSPLGSAPSSTGEGR